MSTNDLSSIKEIVYRVYKRTYDMDLAYEAAHVSKETIALLNTDEEFQERIRLVSVEAKAKLIDALQILADPDEGNSANTQLRALEILGKIIYPERFDENARKRKEEDLPQVNIYLPENNRKID